ncbi:hypothetical protein BZG35_08465 [Brevundimonas sp. LM2]|uniref:thioredoxin family protein n=1 Tax=Brevundimonas sp. LM2 TaxID=1938605 RepID=UPI0009840671|nr:thioredoxin domain-containing protein [Brevundimonas sp. LM2]AQR61680.1 hypothetical protein BZG35_08465 [Brevundimonas sp. LM2]
MEPNPPAPIEPTPTHAASQARLQRQRDAFDALTPSLVAVGDDDFDDQVAGDPGVVVVQFFAAWCGPCHKAAAALEPVAAAGRRVLKLDCEQATATAARFCIGSYPKILLFQRGRLKAIYDGPRQSSAIESWIAQRARGLRSPT